MKRLGEPLAFGEFEFDPRRHELRHGGRHVALQEQPYQILECLLERPDELVTRDELRDRLWPAGVYVEHEKSINVAVMKLREALGDSAEAPRFIVTLPRLGYRFIAPVATPGATVEKPKAQVVERLASLEWGGQATRELDSAAPPDHRPKPASRGLWGILKGVGGSLRGWLGGAGSERR